MRVPFLGGWKLEASSNLNAQRSVNLYPVLDPSGKSILALYGTPGLSLFTTAGNGPVRGLWALDQYLYAVSGNTFYRIDEFGTATSKGTIGTSSGQVSMADNGLQILLLDGVLGYVYTVATGTLTQITSTGFLGGRIVSFQDGYFIVGPNGRQSYQISAQYNGLTWDSTDTAPAEGLPDRLVTLLDDHRELWLFGEKSTEINWDSGNADFPFERIDGAFIEMGCAAAFSPAKADNSVFWLSRNENGQGQVMRANGYVPVIVSNRALEYALGQYNRIDDAIGWTYQQDGHTFYMLTFPEADATWGYDIAVQDPEIAWHQRQSYGIGRNRANCHAFWDGEHYVGDYSNGRIYKQRTDVYSDYGDAIVATRAGQYLHADGKRVSFPHFEVDAQVGVGLNTGQGIDPQIWLDWSDDGGHKFGNQLSRSLGAMGDFHTRVTWNKLGASYGRIFRVGISDPVKRVLLNGYCDMNPGT